MCQILNLISLSPSLPPPSLPPSPPSPLPPSLPSLPPSLPLCREKEGRAYGNLGCCYELLRDYPEAIFHHQKVSCVLVSSPCSEHAHCIPSASGNSQDYRGHVL